MGEWSRAMEGLGRFMIDLNFFKGKKIFITGHTGFKGSWMCRALIGSGAIVTGYSLAPITDPNLFQMANIENQMASIIGDIRNFEHLKSAFDEANPEFVIHMAAQPLVREGYVKPRYTYETNVMGTVNLMECIRLNECARSVVNVTTDKVYLNREWVWGYREDEMLDGFDPYSNSKSCSDLLTHCYINSFFNNRDIAVSIMRAGNVIGGGDFAQDRIIPDCIRAQQEKKPIGIRNPASIRPYQHVLEPVMAYLLLLQRQYMDKSMAGWYNVGPDEKDCVTTEQVVNTFCSIWGNGATWVNQSANDHFHEANFLRLDCARIKSALCWKPRWDIYNAVAKTCEWTKVWLSGGDIPALMDRQIHEYLKSETL